MSFVWTAVAIPLSHAERASVSPAVWARREVLCLACKAESTLLEQAISEPEAGIGLEAAAHTKWMRFLCVLAPFTTRSPYAGLGLFSPGVFERNELVGGHYSALVCHDLSFRQHTKKLYDKETLEMYAVRFIQKSLQLKVKKRRFHPKTAA